MGKGIAENGVSREQKWVSEERREDGEKRMYQNCKDRK